MQRNHGRTTRLLPLGLAVLLLAAAFFVLPGVTAQGARYLEPGSGHGDPLAASLEELDAGIGLAKSAPATVLPGAAFTYTLTAGNNTGLELTNLVITDTVPANATFVSASDGGTLTAGVVHWTVPGPVAAGALLLRTFTVAAADLNGAQIVNDDYGAQAANWLTPTVGSPVVTSIYLPPTNIRVSKSGPSLAIPGETVVYTLIVSNNSARDAEDVLLTDALPPGINYVADDIGTPSSPSTGVYVWNLGTIPAGAEATYQLTGAVKGTVTSGTVLTNQVQVSTTTEESNLTDNSASLATSVYTKMGIATARSRLGQTVMTEGTVTAEPGIFVDANTWQKLYMEDDTAGILVFYSGGLNPVARSNKVRVAGQIQVISGETVILPAVAAHVMDRGPASPVTPAGVGTGAVDESVEGELVQVYGRIVAKPKPFRLSVDDGTGIVQIYLYGRLGAAGDPSYVDTSSYGVGDTLKATGVSRGLEAGGTVVREILPREAGDLKEYFVVTFMYHDVEDVVRPGEGIALVGSFNSWDPNSHLLAADATCSVFSTTLTFETGGTTPYRYVVHSEGEKWDWLNTLDRSVNLQTSPTLHDYRNVDVEFAQLLEPPALTLNLGEGTGPIIGQVGIPGVTNPAGEGRAVWAEVGYGTGTNPGRWSWTPMSYTGLQDGSYDLYAGTLQPAASGVYSYAVRFDGNQGTGNPNAGWTYGDLDGTGFGDRFEVSLTGVVTVTGPILAIAKDVQPEADVERGGTVTYTITLSNTGDGRATGIALVDNLPAGVSFAGWLQQSGATQSNGTIQWAGNLEPGAAVIIVFTAAVGTDPSLAGKTIINSASFTSTNGGAGAGEAAFALVPPFRVYLPLVRLD
jgi:uncharacterized repeat protein (TIGR01451 family)